MTALATFVRFRLFFEAGSDPNHATTAPQFDEDRLTTGTPSWGKYLMNVFEMKDSSGAFSVKERGMFGQHWINITAGDLDLTWTTPDYTAVESAIQSMWSNLVSYIPTHIRLVEHRWYNYGPGVVPPNPPARITTLGTPTPGTASTGFVPQVGTTVTLKTALRRHWGRFYLPLAATKFDTNGQLSTSSADFIATQARDALVAPGTSQGVSPVVWDKAHRVAYGITAVQVDSIPDIQRRRRARTTAYRKTITA